MIAIISLPELGNCHTLKASNSSTLNYVAFFLFLCQAGNCYAHPYVSFLEL